MTRLTKDMRDSILHKIMANIPTVDYRKQIEELVQSTVLEFAPEQVKTLYEDENTRGYLSTGWVSISNGQGSGRSSMSFNPVGLKGEIRIRTDDRAEGFLKKGTLHHAIHTRLKSSQLFEKLTSQDDLHRDVRSRLKANLDSVSTVKRLYDVLEPELHSYIPVVAEGGNVKLPTRATAVADDLRKLGMNLPETPKK